jgi:lipopolysaccharide export system protein LptC
MRVVRAVWDWLSVYLPFAILAVLAVSTYWMLRSAPAPVSAKVEEPQRTEPDYEMEKFTLRTFDKSGQLRKDVSGDRARHFPQTDVLEIQNVRIRSFNEQGFVTVATARRALSNGDASEVRLIGDAQVVRDGSSAAKDAAPHMNLRSEVLQVFVKEERIRSTVPVELVRGGDRITANAMDYNNLDQTVELQGRVRGVLQAPKR